MHSCIEFGGGALEKGNYISLGYIVMCIDSGEKYVIHVKCK